VSRSIALDLAPYNIRVNCIAPGGIQTGMTSYDMERVMRMTQPLHRQGRGEDVANAVVYLASERSAQARRAMPFSPRKNLRSTRGPKRRPSR